MDEQGRQQRPRPLSTRRKLLLAAGGLAFLALLGVCTAVTARGPSFQQGRNAGGKATVAIQTATPTAPPTPVATPTPSATTAPSPTATPAAPPTATPDPGQEICTVTVGGGTFYMLVISKTELDLRACSGSPRFAGTLDDLLNVPGVDRRCVASSNAAIARNHALVAAYGDTKPEDLAAAKSWCQAEGGTEG